MRDNKLRPHPATSLTPLVYKVIACCAFMVSLTSALRVHGQELQSIPDRGFQSGGSYSLTDIETINTTNGNLTLRIPLASLPAGRGGHPGFTLQLLYNSKIWDSRADIAPDPLNPNQNVDVNWLNDSEEGGWRYNLGYSTVLDNRNNHYDNPCPPTQPCGIWIWKLRMSYPDGSLHGFRPVGYNDYLGDGYYNVVPGPNMTYYSTDGTFTRLEYDAAGVWTLYFPDGTRVTNPSGGGQRTYDRNDDYTELQYVSNYNGSGYPATKIVDQFGRHIAIQYINNESRIIVTGVGGTPVTTRILWKSIYVTKTYNARTHFTYLVTYEDYALSMVDQIILPPETGGDLRYTFGYNAPSAPTYGTPSYGWGELSSITLPTGAQSSYQYDLDGGGGYAPGLTYKEVLKNHPTRKDLNYTLEYDGTTSAAPTETWLYSTGETVSSVTAPDGGVTTESFGSTNSEFPTWNGGLVYKSVRPDGTVVEREWQQNRPGIESIPGNVGVNTYVKREYTSVKNAAGTLVKTAIKDYNYDKNGNVLHVAEYDWVSYSSVPRDAYGNPTGIPYGAPLKRETFNTYHVSTPDASVTGHATGTYHYRGSPRLLRSVRSMEIGPGGGQKLARTEFSYDNATTTGNLTQKLQWDSSKGPYSDPLSTYNSIASSFQYDGYGNVTLSTDGRGVQTQLVYGNIGDFTNLYPTETRDAYGTPIQRTQAIEYDFHTGLVTRSTDVDNNVSTATTYDVFGRPVLVKAAEGKLEEARTTMSYSEVSRRVIERSDLNTLGDGKRVSIRHFDQLGRLRLARQLENAATQDADDETTGIKVQVRYTTSGGFNYQLNSQPYRAATSAVANEGPRGWSRTKQDAAGRIVEVQTFQGNALPAPWGSNTAGSGATTTSFDAEFTTVTDAAGKVRRKAIDGLGQIARLDEPDASGYLGPIDSPVQPTFYTYNALAKLTQVTQGSQTRSYQYNSLSSLVAVTSPESGTMSFTLDAAGNMLTRTDARGVTTTYTYDELGRSRTVNYSNTAVNPDIERFYDGATYGKGRFWYNYAGGNYSAGSTVEHLVIDAYDAMGRPKVQRRVFKTNGAWGANFTEQRAYDLAGNVRTLTYPSGHTANYGYDETGRLNDFRGSLGDGQQRVYSTGFLYDEQSRRKQEQFGTDTPVYNKHFYNNSGQLNEIRVSTYSITTPGQETNWNRGALINRYSNQSWSGTGTDNNGNLLLQMIYIPNDDQISGYMMNGLFYTYDSLNRLDKVDEARDGWQFSWRQDFDYDRWGNRTINAANTTDGLPEPQFTVDPATNRLGVPAGYGGAMSYDAAGNLTYDTYTGQGTRAFDAENRMTSGQDLYGQTSVYTYDADGRRTRRKVGGGAEVWQFYGMGGELLAEYAASASTSSPQKEYGYRGGELLITADAPIASGVNLAQGKTATQASEDWGGAASRAVDGNTDGNWNSGSVTHTLGGTQDWWQVDLGAVASIGTIKLWNRTDCCSERLSNFYVLVSDSPFVSTNLGTTLGQAGVSNYYTAGPVGTSAEVAVNRTGRYVRVQLAGTNFLHLAEVQVMSGGGGPGLRAEYFNSLDFTNPALTRTDSNINLDWGNSSPGAGVGADIFTTRWMGNVTPLYSQTYTFYTVTDDGVRLWVNGQLVIDKWIDQGPTEWSGQITLQANTPYEIKMEFYERYGGATAKLYWSSASQPKEIIPSGRLSQPQGGAVNWLVNDQLGTPRMILDKTGSLSTLKRHDYLPFGEEIGAGISGRTAQQGYVTDGVRQKFVGKERDAETGLDYSVNRYYSAAQGRFTSADPAFITSQRLSDPQMLNLYAYARNNPLRFVDPDGLELYVFGPEAQQFVDDLMRATGLKLKYNPVTGKVTIDGPVPGNLSTDAQQVVKLIQDENNIVRMAAIRNVFTFSNGEKVQALIGQQNGGYTDSQGRFVSNHIIDYADVNKLNKPHGSQAPQIALHEATEAYQAALNKVAGISGVDFQKIHEAAIVFENASRSRVPGLGPRIGDGPVLDNKGDLAKTKKGYNLAYIDYTTHIEYITVNLKNLSVISVRVEKKK